MYLKTKSVTQYSSYLNSPEVRYYLSIPEVGSQVVRLMPEL